MQEIRYRQRPNRFQPVILKVQIADRFVNDQVTDNFHLALHHIKGVSVPNGAFIGIVEVAPFCRPANLVQQTAFFVRLEKAELLLALIDAADDLLIRNRRYQTGKPKGTSPPACENGGDEGKQQYRYQNPLCL